MLAVTQLENESIGEIKNFQFFFFFNKYAIFFDGISPICRPPNAIILLVA